jgi:hypothetical protein
MAKFAFSLSDCSRGYVMLRLVKPSLLALAITLLGLSGAVHAQAKKTKLPGNEQLIAGFKEQGAVDDVARCAAHAVTSARGHAAYKSYSFEPQQLKDGKTESWNAPLEAGMVKPMQTRVRVFASGVNRVGEEKKLQVTCGINDGKVDAFLTRDTSIKIKTKS